ncbi:MAG: hypothetical protein IPL65_05805 [Lewinellaceae bacterium]|nr:hypothetical protein [Lewinellaceae bacterium]
MFELSQTSFGRFRRYTVHNPASGMGFSVVPEAGANLLELLFEGQNVLDGHKNPEELEAGKWGKSAVLFPFPNRMRDGKYIWEGKTYEFPLNNAATQNAIHGFARHEAFQVTHIELGTEFAELSCKLDYPGHHAFYPFPCSLEITFNITNRSEFNLTFFLRNKHTGPIPAGFGWHPYFHLTEQADNHRLQLPFSAQVDIDERMLPTGTQTPYSVFEGEKQLGDTELDNCFKVTGEHHLYHVSLFHGKKQLSLTAATNLFPYFQVFTPPHRQSVALEPMSCNVDAFNNGDGLLRIPAGGDWLGAFRLEYSA